MRQILLYWGFALIACGGLTQCTQEKPTETTTFYFPEEKGANRAIGNLADEKNLNSMELPTYDNPMDDIPSNTFDSNFVIPDAPLGQVFVPDAIYRSQGT